MTLCTLKLFEVIVQNNYRWALHDCRLMLNVHGRFVYSCNSARIVLGGRTGARTGNQVVCASTRRVFLNGIKNKIIIVRSLCYTPLFTVAVNVRLVVVNFLELSCHGRWFLDIGLSTHVAVHAVVYYLHAP